MSLFCSQVNGVYLILDGGLLRTPKLVSDPNSASPSWVLGHLDVDSWKPQTSTLLFSNCPDPPESHGLGLSPKAKSVRQPCGLDGEFQTPFSAAAEAGPGFGRPETHGTHGTQGKDRTGVDSLGNCGGARLYFQHGRG